MECNRRFSSRPWFQKMLVSLAFGLFTFQVQAQLLNPKPDITVPPLGIGVQNGGTAVMTVAATALLTAPIKTVNWYFATDKSTNLISSGVATVNLGTAASSTLTIDNVSPANQGNYFVEVGNSSGTTTSGNAALVVVLSTVSNVVSAVAGGTGMIANGFKLQYSAPVGSNLVIQASSDMNNWSSICTNTVPAGGSVAYTDTVAKVYSCRFYRAKIQ